VLTVKKLALEVVNLDDNLEEKFWAHVNQDPLDYFFFILDWKYDRDKTKILLALEEDEIQGMMVIFRKSIVQLRGSRKAARTLLDHLDLEEVEMGAPKEFEDLMLERYEPQIRNEIVLMHLRRGEENITKSHEPVRLSSDDAEQIANLMRISYPDWWGEMTAERVKYLMKRNFWLGIKQDDKVVALGNTRFLDFGSNIGVVATDEAYRNRGYATSIVSALTEEILQRCDTAMIHVLRDNDPAIHIYEKVGFKPYKSYMLIKKAKRV